MPVPRNSASPRTSIVTWSSAFPRNMDRPSAAPASAIAGSSMRSPTNYVAWVAFLPRRHMRPSAGPAAPRATCQVTIDVLGEAEFLGTGMDGGQYPVTAVAGLASAGHALLLAVWAARRAVCHAGTSWPA